MPITGIGTYAPTMQEVINHWTAANATLGATPLTLRGTYTLANFTADRAAILAAINAAISADNTAQITSGASKVRFSTLAHTKAINVILNRLMQDHHEYERHSFA